MGNKQEHGEVEKTFKIFIEDVKNYCKIHPELEKHFKEFYTKTLTTQRLAIEKEHREEIIKAIKNPEHDVSYADYYENKDFKEGYECGKDDILDIINKLNKHE